MSAAPVNGSPTARSRGFSLVEILVALVVGLFLTAGIIQLFVDAGPDRGHDQMQAHLRQEGRDALEVIARDARMVGYAGCTRLENLMRPPHVVAPGLAFTRDRVLLGGTADGQAAIPQAAPGTDILHLQLLSATGAPLARAMGPIDGPIQVLAPAGEIKAGDVLAIADCNTMDVFTARSVAGTGPTTIWPNAPLSRRYLADSQVMPVREVTYFVGGGRARPALHRAGRGVDRLADDVQDMEIRYGEDTDQDSSPEAYLPAAAVASWGRVVSLRISLLLASGERSRGEAPQAIAWRGETLKPSDGRIRATVTRTIALRNRLP